ncbi:phthiocerol/phthiodiolone dimycocerosyl transferase family protein (plasmid) [Bradyrhizobium betae]
MGGLERAFFSHSLRAPIDFSVVAEISGATDEETVVKAFDALRDRHPSLRVEVVAHPSDGLSFAWSDNEPMVVVRHADQASSWLEVVRDDLQRWEDISGAPLMKASVLLAANSFAICLTFNHTISDGRGALAILRDFIHLIGGEHLAALSGLPGLNEFAAEYASAELPAPPPENEVKPEIRIRQVTDDPLQLSILEFDRELTRHLIAKCREESVTVHGAICAAAAIATKPGRTGPIGISSPVDLRATAGKDADCPGLFMGLSPAFLQVAGEDTLWTVARRATDGIMAVRSPEMVAGLTRFLDNIVPKVADADFAFAVLPPQVRDLMISNLGRLSIQTRINSLNVKSIWGPILNTQVSQSDMIGINTLDGILRMVHVSSGANPSLLTDIHVAIEEAVSVDDAIVLRT